MGQRRFCEHHVCFVPAVETPFGPARNDDVVLWLHASAVDADGQALPLCERKWDLVQLSPAEPPKAGPRLANHRAVYRTPIEGDPFRFLEMIGYRFNFEYVRRGFEFRLGGARMTIFRVYKLNEQHRISSAVPVDPGSTKWIVELTSPVAGQEHVVRMSDELFQFAALLTGLVSLVVVDHTSLQNRIAYS
ncbi:hypothetical protein HK105_201159 [Polyrhizophydium stewartii]|uniref:Mediator of RNA polymerase II transcription subunit 18 n=1 Tax=Polyrhizophydium stewartii TaxID=2732419 RepID=A0ABR4NJ24_9FUNG